MCGGFASPTRELEHGRPASRDRPPKRSQLRPYVWGGAAMLALFAGAVVVLFLFTSQFAERGLPGGAPAATARHPGSVRIAHGRERRGHRRHTKRKVTKPAAEAASTTVTQSAPQDVAAPSPDAAATPDSRAPAPKGGPSRPPASPPHPARGSGGTSPPGAPGPGGTGGVVSAPAKR